MPHQNERYGHGYLHHYSMELVEQLVTAFFQTLDKISNGIACNRRSDGHDAQPYGHRPARCLAGIAPAAGRQVGAGEQANRPWMKSIQGRL